MAGPVTMGGNRSKWRPNSAAAMNNNPQGVQSVMQPVAPPMSPTMPPRPVAPNPLPSANPGYGPPAVSGGGPPAANAPGANVPAVQTQPQGQPPAAMNRPGVRIPGPISVPGVTVSPLPSRGMLNQLAQTPYGMSVMPGAYPPAGVVSPPSVPKMNTAPVGEAVDSSSASPSRADDLRQQIAGSKQRMAQSAATPLSPTPPNPFFRPQGRDPQNPSQFDVRNVGPGGGYFVDRGGQIQPRQDTSMARNVMAGQPPEGSASFGRPMNIPGATQTFNGQTYTQPKVYNPGGGYGRDGNGVIPGSMPRLTQADETARAASYREKWDNRKSGENVMSPDEYRVLTGKAMIPFVPSGTVVSPEASAASRLAARESKMARSRGVRGSDVQLWRARRSAEMQAAMNPTGDATASVEATTPNQTQQQAESRPWVNEYDAGGMGTNPASGILGWIGRQIGAIPPRGNGYVPPPQPQAEPAAPPTGVLSPPKMPKRNTTPMQDAVGQSGRPWRNGRQYA